MLLQRNPTKFIEKRKREKKKKFYNKRIMNNEHGNFLCVKSVQIRGFFWSIFRVFGLNTEINGVNLRMLSEYGKIRTTKNSVFGQFYIYTIADIWKTVRVYFGKELTMSGVASWIRRKISVHGNPFSKDKSMFDSTPENIDACENRSSTNECLAIVLV